MFFSLFCNSWDLSMLSKWKLDFWVYKAILPCVERHNKMAVSFNCLQRNQSSFSSADWKCEVKSVSVCQGVGCSWWGKKEGCATKTNELLSHPSRAVVFQQGRQQGGCSKQIYTRLLFAATALYWPFCCPVQDFSSLKMTRAEWHHSGGAQCSRGTQGLQVHLCIYLVLAAWCVMQAGFFWFLFTLKVVSLLLFLLFFCCLI